MVAVIIFIISTYISPNLQIQLKIFHTLSNLKPATSVFLILEDFIIFPNIYGFSQEQDYASPPF